MGRSQRNDNFIDKTFTILADILLKVFPASKQEKQAFFYYRDGMSAQAEGDYAEALETCRCTYKAEYASGPVPKPVRCRYRWYLASEPEILATATGICAKMVQKRSQMCVCDVTLYYFLNTCSQKRK